MDFFFKYPTNYSILLVLALLDMKLIKYYNDVYYHYDHYETTFRNLNEHDKE